MDSKEKLEKILRQVIDTIQGALEPTLNTTKKTCDSEEEFEQPVPKRRPLPSIINSQQKRKLKSIPRTKLKVKSCDVVCLPFQKGNSFPIPRGQNREHLATLKLIGKVTINNTMNEGDARREISSLFSGTFKEELIFNFLCAMPGSKRLMLANTSSRFEWTREEIIKIIIKNCIYIMPVKKMDVEEIISDEEEEFIPDVKEERNPTYMRRQSFRLQSSNIKQSTETIVDSVGMSDDEDEREITQIREHELEIRTTNSETLGGISQPVINVEENLTLRERLYEQMGIVSHAFPDGHDLENENNEHVRKEDVTFSSPLEWLNEHSLKTIDQENLCTIYVRRNFILEDFIRACLKKNFNPRRNLYVTFIGEPGIDSGGLTKEFLDLLSRKLPTWSVFSGQVGNLTLNSSMLSLSQKLPYAAGVAVGMVITHLKTDLPIFSQSLIRHIAGETNFSIHDIPDSYFTTKQLLLQLYDNNELNNPNILKLIDELDYYKDLTKEENKEEFVRLACHYFCAVKNGAHISQFIKGLDTMGIGSAIIEYRDLMTNLLCSTPNTLKKKMDAYVIYAMLEFKFSEPGSNNYQQEQGIAFYLLQFLGDCCCANGEHNPEESVIKCCIRDFWQFISGLTEIPLIMTETPNVKFSNEPYPTANVCTLSLSLPRNLTEKMFRERMVESVLGSPEFGTV